MFLTKFASKVYIVHRRDQLRATKCIQEKCFANDKIEMKWSRTVAEIIGTDGRVSAVRLASTKGEPDEVLPVDGVFVFAGVAPMSSLVKDMCELDDAGYVKVDRNGLTSYPGLYAAGDVTDSQLKQVITAAGDGAVAAFEALKWIDERLCSI